MVTAVVLSPLSRLFPTISSQPVMRWDHVASPGPWHVTINDLCPLHDEALGNWSANFIQPSLLWPQQPWELRGELVASQDWEGWIPNYCTVESQPIGWTQLRWDLLFWHLEVYLLVQPSVATFTRATLSVPLNLGYICSQAHHGSTCKSSSTGSSGSQ